MYADMEYGPPSSPPMLLRSQKRQLLLLVHSLSILWSLDPWYCRGLVPTAHLAMVP